MTVLSDKWIKKAAKEKGIIKPFVSKQVRKEKYLSDYPRTAMTQEFQMSLKFLPTLIQA